MEGSNLKLNPPFAGVYNETAFAALDYILDTAAYHGVKVIFTMADNWQYADSKRNVSIRRHNLFFYFSLSLQDMSDSSQGSI